MVKEEVRNLSFLFTETGFVLDTVDRERQDSKWFQRFPEEDKYSALYDFGFRNAFINCMLPPVSFIVQQNCISMF